MKYSRLFVRPCPFTSTRRKMDEIESKHINPLIRRIAAKSEEVRRITAQYDAAFRSRDKATATKLDARRAQLVATTEKLKDKLRMHQAQYARLQRSLTQATPRIRKKPHAAIRRTALPLGRAA